MDLTRTARIAAFVATLAISAPALAAVPTQLNTQGVLRDAVGDLLDVPDATLVFRLFDAATGGALLWSETQELPVVMGAFSALLPQSPLTELPAAVQVELASGGPLWLSIQLEGQAELPRVPLVSVPYAFTANRALVAAGLDCTGCIDAADINTSTFKAQHLVYEPATGALVTATHVGGAIAQLDDYLAEHLANPDAHHPADSAGLAIRPTSVTVGDSNLGDGTLDLGPGANDALTAAHATTLTGGGNADNLHAHSAQSITGSVGGSCVTLFGSSTPTCPSGYAAAQTGQALLPGAWSGSTIYGVGAPVCASATPNAGSTSYSLYWFSAYSNNNSLYSGSMACSVCCPAAQDSVDGCFSQTYANNAPTDYTGCVSSIPSHSYAVNGAPNRQYLFKRVEFWIIGSAYNPASANWDLKVTRVADGALLARVPAFFLRRSSQNLSVCSYGGSQYAYLVQGELAITAGGSDTLKFEVVDATTGVSAYVATGAGAAGMISGGLNLTGCIAPVP